MESEHAEEPTPGHMEHLEPLDRVEVRLLGSLLEKQRTTPADYPLTANALMRAANQATSRSPVVTFDVRTVEDGCASLKEKGLVRFVHVASGRGTTKYRQILDEAWSLDRADTAVLTLLMLRGPQTVGELKTRSERLYDFDDLRTVTETIERLASRRPALVRCLGRAVGQKEARWCHLLNGEPDLTESVASAHDVTSSRPDATVLADRLDRLEHDLGGLRDWVIEIREALGLDVTARE